jgi:hypothetical protein
MPILIISAVCLYMLSIGVVYESLSGTPLANSANSDDMHQELSSLFWPVVLPLYGLYKYAFIVWTPITLGQRLVVYLRIRKSKLPKAEVIND